MESVKSVTSICHRFIPTGTNTAIICPVVPTILPKTKREGIEVLILDIRGNGGGAMVEALMKKVVLKICLLLFVVTANVKAQAPGEAVEYMNQMGNSFTELKDETWKYLKAVTRG